MYYIVGCSTEYSLDGLIFSILYIFPKTYNVLGSIFYGWEMKDHFTIWYTASVFIRLHLIFFGIKAYANLKINWQQESPSDAWKNYLIITYLYIEIKVGFAYDILWLHPL